MSRRSGHVFGSRSAARRSLAHGPGHLAPRSARRQLLHHLQPGRRWLSPWPRSRRTAAGCATHPGLPALRAGTLLIRARHVTMVVSGPASPRIIEPADAPKGRGQSTAVVVWGLGWHASVRDPSLHRPKAARERRKGARTVALSSALRFHPLAPRLHRCQSTTVDATRATSDRHGSLMATSGRETRHAASTAAQGGSGARRRPRQRSGFE